MDPKQRPEVHVSGQAKHVLKDEASFEIDASQWMFLDKTNAVLPVKAIIPDSPKYAKKKPVPSENGYVTVHGVLSRVMPREKDELERADRFCIAVDDVVFGPRGGSAAKNNGMPHEETVCMI